MPNRVQKRNNKKGKKSVATSTSSTPGNAASVVASQINRSNFKAEESTGDTCEQCGLRVTQEWCATLFHYAVTPSAKSMGTLRICGGCAKVREAKKELNAKCANCKCPTAFVTCKKEVDT